MVAAGHETVTAKDSIRLQSEPLTKRAARPMASPVQLKESVRSTSDTSNGPRSPTLPTNSSASSPRPTYSYAATSASGTSAPVSPVTASAVRSPNPAKRVPNNPADELRSAVNRDVLREELKKKTATSYPAVQRNVSAPVLAAAVPISPPVSPTMISSGGQAGAARAGPGSMMPRNPSIDSTVSSTSNLSTSRVNGITSHRATPDSTGAQGIAAVVAEAGSAEAAIQKLLSEKSQNASQNAQLWSLVEKQRTMILGLNKDLEKALKDKERYRKKVKDLSQSGSTTALTTANKQLEEMAEREDSPSPAVPGSSSLVAASLTGTGADSISSRKESDTSDAAVFPADRSDTPLDASRAPSSVLPSTPKSAGSTNKILRDIDLVEAASASAHENRAVGSSPNSPRAREVPQFAKAAVDSHRKKPSISSPTGSFSAPKPQASRKAPPAPLNLSSRQKVEAAARVTNNIIDPSDSEYDDGTDSGSNERDARGRRKTREEDDHDREVVVLQEAEHRSQSKKDKAAKNPSPEGLQGSPDPPAGFASGSVTSHIDSTGANPTTFNRQNGPVDIVRQRAVAEGPALQKSSTAPSLLSPGLPMSPRPSDRPMNSPMPRAPNMALNSIPMSPRSGVAGLPLSPRPPRQPIPMPPQTPFAVSSPHLARAEAYQPMQSQASSLAKEVQVSEHSTPEREYSSRPAEHQPMTPGDIYNGLVTDSYPELLLPPNALPSIYVKTASSRMRPSRQSYLAAKTSDENPVFILSVHERSNNRQLWRVEKTFTSLAILDEQIKGICNFRERLPDKTLFSGHAPAKIDARRSAIDVYFHRMLESMTDDRPAIVFCKFLSTDAIGAERGEYFNVSVDLRSDTPMNTKRPRREGYLTKRGKNFGGWKARFFVLDGPMFKYYDAEGGTQLGSIKLQNAQIGKQSNSNQTPQEDEDNQFRHAFLVLEPKKKDSSSLVRHVLCAESDEERDLWVDALLQYVDYKDDPEEVAAKATLSATRPELGGPRSPRLQKSLNDLRPSEMSSDSIRTVGYNDTVAGEAPIIGPPSADKVETPSPPHDGNFGPAVGLPASGSLTELPASNHPNISGPTNLQVISNTGDWGMKPPPTPQYKDKKRSLFSGFRGRSSSDLGPGDKIMSPGLPPQEYQTSGSTRAVFGAPLAEAVEFARPNEVVTDLPAVVYRCIEYLVAKNALGEEGIFRLSGSNTIVKGLKDRFNSEGDVNLLADGKYYDIHAVASLLKLYLRELPSSILTRDLHLEFLQCSERHASEKVAALNALVHKLPRANRVLLDALSSLLLSIVNNADVNKMNVRNVGIVFAPTLNVPAPLISSFVEEQTAIFGPPLDLPAPPVPSRQAPAPAAAPTDLRSPRKQMFSDLPTPAYNQTTFQSLGVLHNEDTGMIPMNPTYGAYQMPPQGDGGFGSLNDALKSPTLYSTVSNGAPSSRETKAKRRESALLGVGYGMQKKTSMNQLREQLHEDQGAI